jgi:hypothetical protein
VVVEQHAEPSALGGQHESVELSEEQQASFDSILISFTSDIDVSLNR